MEKTRETRLLNLGLLLLEGCCTDLLCEEIACCCLRLKQEREGEADAVNSVEKKKWTMLGGETVGEGEFGNGGRLLLVVVCSYFNGGMSVAAGRRSETPLCWKLLVHAAAGSSSNCGAGGDGACCSGVRISVAPDQTHMVPLLLAELGCCL
ncbi:hypothetical protein Peur_009981 [Populus x canadensis]